MSLISEVRKFYFPPKPLEEPIFRVGAKVRTVRGVEGVLTAYRGKHRWRFKANMGQWDLRETEMEVIV